MNNNVKQAIIEGRTSLGIELGSTRIKTILIDETFEIIATGIYEWENQLVDGHWTYATDEIIGGLQESYRQLAQYVKNNYGIFLQKVGSIGCSAMMQGYIALNQAGELLVPFRTWRNATTAAAASELTNRLQFKMPQRWSVTHLFQAILNKEEHVADIDYITTLSGYVHWMLTGNKVLGIGDASGMFPIDGSTKQFNAHMLDLFDDLIAHADYPWKLKDILPRVLTAGEHAGHLHETGARLLDSSGNLQAGIPMCPPEGDGGTGTVATNSVGKRMGNISAGTSIFAQFVLDKELSKTYPEIDIMSTPGGDPVGIILANNCSSDINAWVGLFGEFYEAMGLKPDMNQLFSVLFDKAMQADPDGGGLLSYGYYSAENITGITKGRPLFVRTPQSHFTLANFMRVHLFSAFAALRLGMDILRAQEHIQIDHIRAHGGLFKTPLVGQKICAAALNVPVSVMTTAGEGGAWGMAILASYMMNKGKQESLSDYLATKVFNNMEEEEIHPESMNVAGFDLFMDRYIAGLEIERAAADHLA